MAVSDRTFVVRSLPSTFADLNGNFEFDSGVERRGQYNLAAAIEIDVDAVTAADSSEPTIVSASFSEDSDDSQDQVESRTMRALVYADAQMFSDGVLTSIGLNAALVADGIRWLGGEEDLGGEIESEEDVPIVHNQR